jgi:hypothetical protein
MKDCIPLRALIVSVLTFTGASAAEDEAPTTQPAAPEAAPAQAAPAAEAPAKPAASDEAIAALKAAAAKLAEAKSYAWTQTSAFGNQEPRVSTGKKGAGGHVLTSMPGRNGSSELLVRAGKALIKRDGTWEKVPAGGDEQGPGRWMAAMIENFREPSKEAADLVSKVTEVTKEADGTFSAKLSEEAAQELMRFGRGPGRRGGAGGGAGGGGFEPPPITGAGGTIRFTVSNGILSQSEVALTGRMNFNGEDRDISRKTTVQFEGIDSTAFDIPEAAAGMLAE